MALVQNIDTSLVPESRTSSSPGTSLGMTVEEFLAWKGGLKGITYELVHGVIRAQEAASDTHGTIQTRIATIMTLHLDKHRQGCRVVTAPGVKPRLLARWNHRIPEMAVTCQPNQPGAHHIPDPILIVEILSPSNSEDTWSNVPLYASLPSIAEILVVASEKVEAQLLRRQADGSWPQEPEAIATGGTVRLDSIGLEFPLTDVYRDTHLLA
jgi:Uma2 family endonuclease